MSGYSCQMRVTETITIHAPIERVFAVFTDLEPAAERIAGIDPIAVQRPGFLQRRWK